LSSTCATASAIALRSHAANAFLSVAQEKDGREHAKSRSSA